jgi:HD-like signal output (HDOD) protein
MNRTEEVFRKLETVQNLPTLPVVISTLRKALLDPNGDARRIAAIIEDDPAMMARILKVVNSALYSAKEPINSLQFAVSRMGFTAISNIALSTSIFSTFPADKGSSEFSREEFWRHSICVGIAVNVMYERCRNSLSKRYGQDLLHLAGLLHDIGKIVWDQVYRPQFTRAVRLSRNNSKPLLEMEGQLIGCDHAQVGAWLGLQWNMATEILQTVRWHHDPMKADVEYRELVMLCHVANYICNNEKIGDGGDTASPSFQHEVWTALGLTVRDISDIVDQVQEKSKESEVLMSFV